MATTHGAFLAQVLQSTQSLILKEMLTSSVVVSITYKTTKIMIFATPILRYPPLSYSNHPYPTLTTPILLYPPLSYSIHPLFSPPKAMDDLYTPSKWPNPLREDKSQDAVINDYCSKCSQGKATPTCNYIT